MNSHSEGYKWVIDKNWGRIAKIGFLDQKPRFRAQKKTYTSWSSPCSGHARKKLFKEDILNYFPNLNKSYDELEGYLYLREAQDDFDLDELEQGNEVLG